MSKQTLKSLLGASDQRKQVELNLNPVALQPTIRSGGQFRVAVQETPKTFAALQLAENLKTGVDVYGAAVRVSQDKAEDDVAAMSEEDFDKFLEQGLDKEGINLFGYTKAYNQALAKKYYAEEMPTKLQAIAVELHKDPYKYKDPAEFEGAAIAAVNEAYDEADELLGGNVFSQQANNVLKSATKADFIEKQNAVFINKLPEITRKVQSDVAFKAFSELDDVANVKDTIDQQILVVTDAVGNRKEAAAIVTKAYLDNIEALSKQEGKEELAQALLDELDDTTVAGLGSQGRRKFGKEDIELFNTSANRLRIEELENNIETAGVSGYNAKLARAREAQASLELEAFGLIAEANGDETTALARFEEIEAEIRNGSVTINGVTYKDTVELNEIRKFIAGARSNKDLFVHNAKLNFVNNNTGGKRAAVNQLTTQGALASINAEAAARLVSVKPNPVTGGMDVVYTPEGATFLTDFNSELEQLELQLADALLGDTSLSVGERITEYSKLYPTEVTAKMQEWLTTRLNSVVPPKPEKPSTPAVSQVEEELAEELSEITNDEFISEADKAKAKKIIIQEELDRKEGINFITDADGTRRLKGTKDSDFMSPYPAFSADPTAPYQRALELGQFKNSDELAQGFDAVHKTFSVTSQKRQTSAYRYNMTPFNIFREETFVEKARKKGRLRDTFSLYGLSITELAEDSFNTTFSMGYGGIGKTNSIPLTDVYGQDNPFSSTPIVYEGSIKNTVEIVQGYFKNKESYEILSDATETSLDPPLPDVFTQAAKNYGISVDTMMKQMEAYLLTNNFISK